MLNRIRMLRKERGLTMKELGAIIGAAESTVSQYETGRREPDLETLKKIADYFSVTIGYLVGQEDVRTDPIKKEDPDVSGSPRAQLMRIVESMPDADLEKLDQLIKLMFPQEP